MKVMQHAASSMFGRTALALVAVTTLGVSSLMAGAPSGKAPAPVAPPEAPFITGTFSVMYDTHFPQFCTVLAKRIQA